MAKKENTAFKMKFIERLASRLDIPYKTADLIYDTYGVIVLELLEEYDRVKALDFLYVEKRMTTKKKMINVQRGEEIETTPKLKLHSTISRNCKDWQDAQVIVEKYREEEEQRRLHELQIEQEQKEREAQLELERKQRERERKKQQRKAKRSKRKEQEAIRRLIKYEEMFQAEEAKKYQKELDRRRKGK